MKPSDTVNFLTTICGVPVMTGQFVKQLTLLVPIDFELKALTEKLKPIVEIVMWSCENWKNLPVLAPHKSDFYNTQVKVKFYSNQVIIEEIKNRIVKGMVRCCSERDIAYKDGRWECKNCEQVAEYSWEIKHLIPKI